MKLIPLSVGANNQPSPNAGKYFAMVDDEDYDELMRYNWRVRVCISTSYAQRSYTVSPRKRTTIGMHRHILKLKGSSLQGDHIDHNGLNNQRSNLRAATIAQNNANRTGFGKSKYLGVCFHKRVERWQAALNINGKQKFIGKYMTEIEAAKAYDKRAIEVHGEFANLNFKETSATFGE